MVCPGTSDRIPLGTPVPPRRACLQAAPRPMGDLRGLCNPRSKPAVSDTMSARGVQSKLSSRLIILGATVFIIALAVAAAFEADLRGLHLVQASMYVATIVLSRQGNRWGYFLGISAASFWNYTLLFVSPLPARFLQHPFEPD